MATKVGADDFKKEVLEHKGLAMVDFYADWCGPCRATEPIIEELSTEMKDTIKIVKIDVDADPDIASQYGVFSIPTFVIFKDGKNVSQFSGARDKSGFVSEIDKAGAN